jgi:hypothetical protein
MKETVEFEQLTGLKATDLQGILSMDIISKLLWIMLKRTVPEITLENTMSLVDENASDIAIVAGCVTSAINSAFGAKPDNANPQPPAVKTQPVKK